MPDDDATGPRAIGLLLPSLPVERWVEAYDTAWLVSAAVSGAYRADPPRAGAGFGGGVVAEAGKAGELALASGDEHAIKFTEVAVESHRRGNPHALAAAGLAAALPGD